MDKTRGKLCSACNGKGLLQHAMDSSRRCTRCYGTGRTGPWLNRQAADPPREPVPVVTLPLPGSEGWKR